MAANKGLVSWIIMAILIVVGLAVGWSIWSSLQDTRAKLKAQEEKMKELESKDAALNRYVDSLNVVLAEVRAREAELAAQRDDLKKRLEKLQHDYNRAIARLDKLWEAKDVIHELDGAFPNWAGQFFTATRHDGVHGLIAPQFFHAEVLEIKTELDTRQKEVALKDSTIASFENSMALKDEEIRIVTLQADSIRSTYNNLFAEYQTLDQKYRTEVKSHWFKFSLGNAVYAGVGFGAGFLVGNAA